MNFWRKIVTRDVTRTSVLAFVSSVHSPLTSSSLVLSIYLGSQVAAGGGCERDVVHRMNEGYRAWGELKSVLSNREFGIKAKKCL